MIPQIGDFIALATLAAHICQALNSVHGSKFEFSSLLDTLEALSRAMLQAEALVLTCRKSLDGLHHDSSRLTFLKSVSAELRQERAECENLLGKFLLRFQDHNEALREGKHSIFKTAVTKLSWMVKKEEAAVLEERIKTHMHAFQLHLQTYCYASMRFDLLGQKALLNSVDHTLGRLTIGFDDMKVMLSEAMERIDMVRQNLPRTLGYSWGPDSPIRLIDGLGRRTLLPLMLASTPEIFREVLLIMHRNGPGYEKVEDGKYVVSDEDFGGVLIPTNKWSDSLQPGRHIGMSFVLRLPPSSNEDQCPRCKTLDTILKAHLGQRRCPKCHMTFKIDSRERTRPFRRHKPRPHVKPRHSTSAEVPRRTRQASPNPKELPRSNTILPDEFDHPYQRVHYERDAPCRGVSTWQKDDPEFVDFIAALPPIHHAAATGNLEYLDELLDDEDNEGLNWRVPSHSLYRHDRTGWDFTGAPPIHFAAYYGHRAAVVHLLRCGADIDGKDSAGTTALHAACWTGNEDLFRLLIKKGADRFICDYDGWSPSVYAMLQGHTAFSSLFAEGIGEAGALLLKIYEIRHAAKQGKSDSVLSLLAGFDDGNDRTRLLDTALLGASEGGHNVLLQKLLDIGADACAVDETGSTALHWAGWGGHTEIGNLCWDELESASASGNSSGKGHAADRLAVRSPRHESLMLLLLEYGADINQQNCEGCAPLHWVAGAGSVPMIRFFLQHGGRVDITDRCGRTVRERCEETGDREVVELLDGFRL